MPFVVGQVSATVSANTAGFSTSMNKVKAEGTSTMQSVEKANATAMGNISKAGENASKNLIASFEKAGKKMQTIGKSMTKYITLPLLAIGAGAFKMGKDFEKEMQKVVGLVGIAQEQVDEWGKEILEMGPRLGVAPKELAEGLFFVTSAGIRGAEAMQVLETAAKGSMVGLGETAVIADALTSAINAYGSANLSSAQAADILTAAVREGKLEASALAPVMGNLLPIASSLELSFSQVAGALAVMSRTGTDAAEGATSLRSIMMFLQKPSEEAKDVLDSVGLSMQDLRDMARKEPDGLLQVMRLLDNTFGDNEEAMAQIIPNIRALSGVMNMLSQDGDVVDQMLYNITNSSGMLDSAVEANADTMELKWKKALAEMQVTMLSLFDVIKDSVAPIIENLGETFKKVTDWLKGLNEEQRQTVMKLGLVAIAIGPVLILLGKITVAVTTLIPLMTALFANPVGIVIGLVAAIGLAGAAIIKLGDKMMDTNDVIEVELKKQTGMFGLSAQEIYQVQKDNVTKKLALIDEEIAAEEDKYIELEQMAQENMTANIELAEDELKELKKIASEEMKALSEAHSERISAINEEYGVATGLSKSKLDIIKENYQEEEEEAKKMYASIVEAAELAYRDKVSAANKAYEEEVAAIKNTYQTLIDESTEAHNIVMKQLDEQLAREQGAIDRQLDMTIGAYEDQIAMIEGATAEEIAQRKKTRETARAIELEDLIVAETNSEEKQKLIEEREELIQGIIMNSANQQQETSKWLIRQNILDAKEEAAEKEREAEETTEKLREEAEQQYTDKITELGALRDTELETLTNLYNDEITLLEEKQSEELAILAEKHAEKLALIEQRKIAAITANEAIRKSLEENEKASYEYAKEQLQNLIDYYNEDWMTDRRAQLEEEKQATLDNEREKTDGIIAELERRKVLIDTKMKDIEESNDNVIKGIYKNLEDMDFNDIVQSNMENYFGALKEQTEKDKVASMMEGLGDLDARWSSFLNKDKTTIPISEDDIVGNYAVGTAYVPRTGLAMVHEGEQIIPAGMGDSYGAVNMYITQNITDRATAEYSNDYLMRTASKLQRRGVGGAFA